MQLKKKVDGTIKLNFDKNDLTDSIRCFTENKEFEDETDTVNSFVASRWFEMLLNDLRKDLADELRSVVIDIIDSEFESNEW